MRSYRRKEQSKDRWMQKQRHFPEVKDTVWPSTRVLGARDMCSEARYHLEVTVRYQIILLHLWGTNGL